MFCVVILGLSIQSHAPSLPLFTWRGYLKVYFKSEPTIRFKTKQLLCFMESLQILSHVHKCNNHFCTLSCQPRKLLCPERWRYVISSNFNESIPGKDPHLVKKIICRLVVISVRKTASCSFVIFNFTHVKPMTHFCLPLRCRPVSIRDFTEVLCYHLKCTSSTSPIVC